jgi:predicted dehydrogenase
MLKFSLLGFGHIGRVHKNAIEITENAQLISIIDINHNDAEPDVKIYRTLEAFLSEDTETDIVIIATPNGLHRDHALRCLKAGKNIFIEKPIALNSVHATEIIETAKKLNKRVFSSMQLRFSPPVSYVKKLIENDALGEIYMVNIQCYWNRNKNYYNTREWHGTNEMDGGVLYTQFSHFIDIVNFWFEDVNCTNASFYNFNHQGITEFGDSGKLDFTADGAQGNMIFTTSVFEKNYESNITIIAEKGTVKIGDQYLNELKYSNLKDEVYSGQNFSTEVKNFHPKAYEEIVSAMAENCASVLDGEFAVDLVKFIEGAYHLSESGLAIT